MIGYLVALCIGTAIGALGAALVAAAGGAFDRRHWNASTARIDRRLVDEMAEVQGADPRTLGQYDPAVCWGGVDGWACDGDEPNHGHKRFHISTEVM